MDEPHNYNDESASVLCLSSLCQMRPINLGDSPVEWEGWAVGMT